MGNPDKEFLDAETKIFDADCKPIEHVYVDLEYIQDLRLGAVLNMLKVKEEVAYLMHNLPKYNSRYDRQTAKYFKALKIDEARIDRVLHRPLAVDKICVTAPFTSVYYQLHEMLSTAIKHARAYCEHQPNPIELVINCADVKYPKLLQDTLCATFKSNLGVDARFESDARYRLSDRDYLGYDLMFLYDVGQFVNQHATAFVGNGLYENKRIVAQPYLEDEILAKTEDPQSVLDSTERGLGIYCEFSYLRSMLGLTKW